MKISASPGAWKWLFTCRTKCKERHSLLHCLLNWQSFSDSNAGFQYIEGITLFISSLALPTSRLVIFLTLITGNFSFAAAESLPVPLHFAVGGTKQQIAANVLAARRYAAFWNTGDVKYAAAALAPGFIDRTLPAGRPQGAAGPLQASQVFRRAVPDLTAEIQHMVVAGDRVSVHLRFKGHFTGRFGDTVGQGQAIDFLAFDAYRVVNGKITENWHL